MKEEKPPVVAYRIKMTSDVAAATKGKAVVSLKMPLIFVPGTRLYMMEWNGGPMGRADLCCVVGVKEDRLVLERRYCWQQGAPDNLDELSYTISPDQFAMITKAAL